MRQFSFAVVILTCVHCPLLQGVNARRLLDAPFMENFEKDENNVPRFVTESVTDVRPQSDDSPVLFRALGMFFLHGIGLARSSSRIPDRRKQRNRQPINMQDLNGLHEWVVERLQRNFPVDHLEVIDVTDGHAMEAFSRGSNRALDPKGLELRLTVVSSSFADVKLMERQRMVNKALEPELLAGSIHALPRMKTLSVDQWQETHREHKDRFEDMHNRYGAGHARTLQALSEYADALAEISCLVEAEPLRRRVLETSRATLGNEHPDTLKALQVYADLLENIGREVDAASLRQEFTSGEG